jgi:hypothetical protein
MENIVPKSPKDLMTHRVTQEVINHSYPKSLSDREGSTWLRCFVRFEGLWSIIEELAELNSCFGCSWTTPWYDLLISTFSDCIQRFPHLNFVSVLY